MSPVRPQRSTSSPKCAAYARIAPSTASMCLRSESLCVHSSIKARAASRAGSGVPGGILLSPAEQLVEIAILLGQQVGGRLLLRLGDQAQRVRDVGVPALAILAHHEAQVAH